MLYYCLKDKPKAALHQCRNGELSYTLNCQNLLTILYFMLIYVNFYVVIVAGSFNILPPVNIEIITKVPRTKLSYWKNVDLLITK